jgi:putative hydrolase of HD superfamily
MEDDDALKFFFELGMLRRIHHDGFKIIGIKEPDTVAEHGLRAAQIGYVLAVMEGVDPEKVCSMLVFHDIGECRTGDRNRINSRYLEVDEKKAVAEQTSGLDTCGKEIMGLWAAVDMRSSKEGIVAKDADYLEQAITAKEFLETGHKYAEDWINNVEKVLRTGSAKRLIKKLRVSDSNSWWQGLKFHKDMGMKK